VSAGWFASIVPLTLPEIVVAAASLAPPTTKVSALKGTRSAVARRFLPDMKKAQKFAK
jgi:hypothetical protein